MEEEIPLAKFIELGDRYLEQGDADRGIHYYNRALKTDLENPAVNLKLAEAYRLKAEQGGVIYYTLAMEPLRRVLKADPRNEAAHEKLMVLAFKAGTLDTLTREYAEKAKADTTDAFYAKYLKRAYALSLMESESKVRLAGYTPAPYIKFFFDLVILPGGAMTIAISNMGLKFKPFFILGVTMFLFYCAYRGILYMMMRRE
ncbi:MAG: hypothetical protein A2234_03020 [Elusimicrobia bacterium RIFOXYA2_FULL_58_8]|nr:MAG: hypothetical protein A2285_00105 [Elusimicrobia bacterium RIFOXYA12_FULL_57_11]OGS12972.1 MAG: hypothetical protein A2234_03020 [Elusimicrobia bacterium RIFOXYA2_FULL_58_8]